MTEESQVERPLGAHILILHLGIGRAEITMPVGARVKLVSFPYTVTDHIFFFKL